jgi:hypothetical protein
MNRNLRYLCEKHSPLVKLQAEEFRGECFPVVDSFAVFRTLLDTTDLFSQASGIVFKNITVESHA